MSDKETRDAIAARDKFLEKYPHLKEYQDEIDQLLDKAGDKQGRMAVLGMLMQERLLALNTELFKLVEVFNGTKDR
jgi:hypothetical protein